MSLVEQLGEHSYVHLDQPGGAVLIAKAPGDTRLAQGDRASFRAASRVCPCLPKTASPPLRLNPPNTTHRGHSDAPWSLLLPGTLARVDVGDDARRMKALGIEQVRIAEFAWSRIEPTPGEYNWGWLDRAVDVLGAAGLQVVMCTPTAPPPKWLIDRHPDILPIGADGRPRAFGSRRHYDFSSPSYFEASQRICTAVAERYGKHPAVAFWQTDNELGCHDTVASYSPAAVGRFRSWLQARYESIDALNDAWGNVFWSMEYRGFDEIDAAEPHRHRRESEPSARLPALHVGRSGELSSRMQVDTDSRACAGRDLLHNFMGFFTELRSLRVRKERPRCRRMGQLSARRAPKSAVRDDVESALARTGHPDISRVQSRLVPRRRQRPPVGDGAAGRAGQLGAVEPGAESGHGAAVDLGSVRARRGTACRISAGARRRSRRSRCMPVSIRRITRSMSAANEAGQVAAEIRTVLAADAQANAAIRAKVALVYDYEAKWLFEIHPQGADFHYPRFAFEYYSALRSLGLDVDVVPVDAPLDGYRLIVVPPLPVVPADFAARLARSGAHVVFGPRTGSKTEDLQIPVNLPPGALAPVLPLRVWRVESMRPNVSEPVRLADSSASGAEDGARATGAISLKAMARLHSTCARVLRTVIPRMCKAGRSITSRACSTMH